MRAPQDYCIDASRSSGAPGRDNTLVAGTPDRATIGHGLVRATPTGMVRLIAMASSGTFMNQPLSVLGRARAADVCFEPFPHLIIDNALPDDVYAELSAAFPPESVLGIDSGQDNKRWDYGPRSVAANPEIAPIWKDMIAYHTSAAFFQEIVSIFYEAIHARYPLQFPSRRYMGAMRAGVREFDSFRTADVLMDAMISGNTPARTASSVRTSHVDQGRKLYSGLFYMRRRDDDSIGGDLTISRLKRGYRDSDKRQRLFKRSYVDDKFLDCVKTVRYSSNTLVLFINTLDSIHGVTPRAPTSLGRYFVNLVGEVNPRLYRVPKLFRGHGSYGRLMRPAGEPRPLPVRLFELVRNL